MKDLNPSPLPWKLEIGDSSHRYTKIIAEGGVTVHYMYSVGDYKSYEREISNAKLMWAGPELYSYACAQEAELRVLRHLVCEGEISRAVSRIDKMLKNSTAAIYKTEGRS